MYRMADNETYKESMQDRTIKDGKGQSRLYWTAVACVANGAV